MMIYVTRMYIYTSPIAQLAMRNTLFFIPLCTTKSFGLFHVSEIAYTAGLPNFELPCSKLCKSLRQTKCEIFWPGILALSRKQKLFYFSSRESGLTIVGNAICLNTATAVRRSSKILIPQSAAP